MSAITMKQILDFNTYLTNEERSRATVEKYQRDLKAFCSWLGEKELNKSTVLSYKEALGKNYAVASANSMIAAINCFFRFCGWNNLCVKQFRIQRQAYTSSDRELSRAEYIRLLDAANKTKNTRLNLIIQTICSTGIRVSELEYITVEALKIGEATVRCKGKNRRIFIVPQLKKKLLRYVKEHQILSGPVFVTRNGRAVSRHNIWKEMKSLCAEARVSADKVFPHNLRHLFARTFYGIEKDIVKLADILGHSSINTTRIYTVTTGEEHRRKMENMHLIL